MTILCGLGRIFCNRRALETYLDRPQLWDAILESPDNAAHFVMASSKEKLQSSGFFPEKEAYLQPGAAFEDIFPQSSAGYSSMNMRLAKAFQDNPQRLLRPRKIRVAQIFKRMMKARTEENGGFTHASIFP